MDISKTAVNLSCPSCEKVFTSKAQAKLHSKIEHEDQRFFCEICDKEYKSRYGVYSHQFHFIRYLE